MTNYFNIGDVVSNQEICDQFKCSPQGGMRRSLRTGTLVIIAKKGLYQNRWDGDILYYTGMGQRSDQNLDVCQNKTLANSRSNGVEIHLFEALYPKEYTYRGIMELIADPFYEYQQDCDGTLRKVCVFPLRRKTLCQSTASSTPEKSEINL